MKVMLVGGHNKANFLTKNLVEKWHAVTVVNTDLEWCKLLSNIYDVVCVHGDGTKPYVLQDAGAANMDTVIALSNLDSTNLIVCQLAKKQFGVKRTLAVVNDPKNARLFRELGVNKCISATQMITDVIEQEALVEDIESFLPFEDGKVAVYQMEVCPASPVVGKSLMEIDMASGSIVGCVIRGEQTIIPNGHTRLLAGDKLILLSSKGSMDDTVDLIAGK